MKTDEKGVDGNMERVKDKVRRFWDSSPCGTYLIKHKEGTKEYFEAIADYRYNKYPYAYSHIPRVVGFEKWKGKRVLEIGCGVGTDLSQFAKHGAIVTGIDLTQAGIELAKKRFEVLRLEGDLKVADAENLPFEDGYFDLVYSFGVLHHTPDTQKAINEAYRVLKPNGKAIVMLYHKRSLEYLILMWKIMVKRKYRHLPKNVALSRITEQNKNPNGPLNPLTKMYTRHQARELFSKFRLVKIRVYWVRIPHLGCTTSLLSRAIGWHLIIEARK